MKEYVARHIQKTATGVAEGFAGSRITLKWRKGNTGTYDTYRRQYYGGTASWIYEENMPALIKSLKYGDVQYGGWGACEIGDLIVCINREINTEDLPELRVIFQKQEYIVIPNTPIPYGSLSGLIGDEGLYRALHCRILGEQQGVK